MFLSEYLFQAPPNRVAVKIKGSRTAGSVHNLLI